MVESAKRPWSWIWMVLISVLCGLPGSYLIVWQNLRRIGRKDVGKKFLIVGGIIVLVTMVVLMFLPISKSLSRGLGNGLAMIFPLWLYSNYLKQWQQQNPKGAGFSWSLMGWGLLGLILYLVLAFVISFVLALIFPDLFGS